MMVGTLAGKNLAFIHAHKRPCPIEEVLERQEYLHHLKTNEADPRNFIIFTEHNHVYTMDPDKTWYKLLYKSRDDKSNCLLPAPLLAVRRSGSITYHGPGQLVCYLILDMKDMGFQGPLHLTSVIDETIKEVLEKFGIQAYTVSELCNIPDNDIKNYLISRKIITVSCEGKIKGSMEAAGVWVVTANRGVKKIASRGITISKGVTKFGFALNVTTCLEFFDWIYPCGLDIKMTSIRELTRQETKVHEIAELVAEILTKKTIYPTDDEIAQNPRERSAKLRAITRIANQES